MNNSSMTLRPSKFVERGNIDTLTQIHDLSLSWFTLYYSSYLFILFLMLVCLFYGVLTPLSTNFLFIRGGQFFG
jgi:hypothetical protein